MYRKRPAIIALFTVLIVLSWTVGVMAVPPLPSSFYGTVKVNGENVAFGTVVSAWIGGVKYAEDGTSFYAGDSNYGLQVPGDDPGTLGKDGGVEGETIVFRIGNLTADQTAIWHSGPNVHRDLTYTSSVQHGSITIRKETNPDGWGGFVFGGDLGWFGLDDGDSKTFDCLNPDNYDVTESVPRGWNLDQVECTGGDYNSITDGVQVQLGVGQDVVCTFTNEVQPGSITVVKETDPDGGTGFSFSGDLGGFSLDDDGSQAFGSLTPGDYDITEAVPAGWGLGSVVCTGGDSGRITNGVTVHLGPDEDVTCTFTNVEPPGSIMVWKETDPDGWGPFDFGGDLGLFSLSDNSGRLFSTLASGQYDVTEVVPGGWNLVDVTCTGGSNTGIANGVRVQLGAGEDVICTFTNEAQPGSITVVKDTDPAGGMGFGFSGDLGGFSLDDDGSRAFGSLTPGDYDITEVVPGGWGLGSVVCTGGDSSQITNGVTVHLGPDEDVTCTFTNVEEPPEPGSVTIWKQTDPAGGTGFGFSGDLGSFTLDDGQGETTSSLLPGDYDITEDVPAGWDLTGVVCTGGDYESIADGVWVHLGSGEDIVCTFENTEFCSVTVAKVSDPSGGTGYSFAGDLGSFSLDDGESKSFEQVPAGDWSITEVLPSGWKMDSVVCTGADSESVADGVMVHMDPGDDVTCTFTNVTQPGSITIAKATDPAGGVGFEFAGDLGGFRLDDGESETFTDVSMGTYDVTEVVPAGWVLQDVVCTGGATEPIPDGVRVHLDEGEAILCTFTNVQHRFYFPWVAVGPKSGSFIDARRRTRLRASLHLWRGGRPGARRCHSLGQDLGELSRNPWLRRGLGPVGTWASCHGPPPATQGA